MNIRIYAQPSAEQAENTAAITDDATASAEQVAEAQELPRGHFRLPEHGDGYRVKAPR